MLLANVLACAGSRATFSLAEMSVSPPSLMVAKKSSRTLYLILDPAKVPARMTVLLNGEKRGGELIDVQEFVKRDLKKAFLPYFDDVQVIPSGQPLGPKPCVVADVKVDRVEVTSPQLVVGVAALTWGLGLRASESDDYLYSFAGESTGTPTTDMMPLFRTMFESAIVDMLHGYSEKQVHKVVLELP